ncbi:DUF4113 domain-containing protein [Providencia alcalifaciens]
MLKSDITKLELQGIQSQSALWKMKQQFLSPRRTTQLSDIPVVKC